VDWQATLDDLSSAMSQSISKDGQTTYTGNQPMGGYKLTGLGAGSAAGDSARFEQLFSQGLAVSLSAAATVNIGAQTSTAITVTGTGTITSFGTAYNGPRYVKFEGVCTLTHSSSLVMPYGEDIVTVAGHIYTFMPDGNPATGWRLINSADSIPANDSASGTLWTTVQGFANRIISSAGASVVGFIQSGAGAVLRTLQDKAREKVNTSDYYANGVSGAKVDPTGTIDSTLGLQAAINYSSANGYTLESEPGDYLHTGLVIDKPLKWVCSAVRGPVYGLQTGFKGTVFKYTPTTGDALTITAAGLLSNQGLAVEMESVVFEGNKNVPGAVSGGGINLIGDAAGETFFVSGSVFKNVHVRNAKGSPWTITGTCFLNTWENCAGVYSGGYGLTHNKGSGNPTNNNWFGGYLSDNGLAGLNCNGGKMTMTTTNISQNAGGGVIQDGGYLILDNCDYEQNTGDAVSVVNSSAATLVRGGMIHKTPGSAAATGIRFGAGCAANVVDGMLFTNFDNAADRILAFDGGASLEKFDYRAQNVLATAFPTSLWTSINSIPTKEKAKVGTVVFAGSGVGTRTTVITFATAFESAYTIILTLDGSGIDPSQVDISIDYSTQALGTITAKAYVAGVGYGDVVARYIAIGR
jgi:hypothetical protein